MADNVTFQSGTLATVPAGTEVSADEDTSNGLVQRIKLAVSADGSSVHIGADADGLQVQGAAAENAAVAGNPNLVGGRYDASDRTLGDGDVGAIALDADGAVRISDGGNSVTIDSSALTTLAGAVSGTEFQVDVITSALPSGAATSANQSTANTALAAIQTAVELLDNAISGTEMQVDIVSSALPTGAATSANQSTANTALAAIQAAVELLDNTVSGSELQVDIVSGTVTANLSATDNAVLDTIETNTDFGTVTGGGTETGALRVTLATNSTGVLSVDDNGSSLTVDNTDLTTLAGAVSGSEMQVDVVAALPAGTNNIGDVDVATLPGVAGDVADDAADSGNPVKIGAVVKPMDATDPGEADAENDRAHLIADENRRLYVNDVHPNLWSAVENNSTAQTNNELKAAPGPGLSLYVTDIVMSTDTAMNIKLVENTGSPTDKAGPYYFAANGGIAMPLKTPIKLSANVNLGYTSSAAGNHTIQVHGFIAP